MSNTLILYTKAECGLCEQAAELLAGANLQARKVDITLDIELLERYRLRIPVVSNGDRELGWPFDSDALSELAKS